MVWAFDQKCPSPSAKLVLLKLADHADDDGKCWPSQSVVARDCGLSRQTVNEQIGALVRLGLIRREQRMSQTGQQTNLYFLLCREIRHPLSVDPTPLSPQTTPPVVSADTEPSIEPSIEERTPHTPRKRGASLAGFSEWWESYPHKVGKGAAERAWPKALSLATAEDLAAGVRRYVETKPEDRPWCNPATWLNQRRWLDQPGDGAVMNGHAGPQGPPPSVEDAMDLWRAIDGEARH